MTARRHNPEDLDLNLHRRENLTTYLYISITEEPHGPEPFLRC
jgi:hypothetical protein